MKIYISLLLAFSFCMFSCLAPSDDTTQEQPKKRPADFMYMQRAYPHGYIKTNAISEAMEWRKSILGSQRNGANVWDFVGPLNIGGRITDIEIPIDASSTYFVGAASGGVFKTTNAGATWQPIFDGEGALSVGDMEISKNNTNHIWVGTGEVNAGGGSLVYDGNGIYKSEDGGNTWENKGLPASGSIGKVLIDPNNDDVIFAAAMGPLFRNGDNRGVFRSQDGGATWEQVLFVNDVTGAIDMAIHPNNGDIVYAALWERVRRPQFNSFGGENSGLYRSLDGGDTWSEMTVGLPSQASEKGRISIAIAPSNPNVLYARYADAQGSIQGVYRSDDGGDTWQERNSSQLQNVGFHWWFRGIYIDPLDEDVIYNVDFIVQKSTDGGANWSLAFPSVHVDQHALAFNAQTPGEVLLGNDGGLYYSDDDGLTSTKDLGLPITQFYRMYVDPQNEDKIYAGAQDNSTMRTTTGGLSDWNIINGGDGFQPLVDATDSNVIYALSQRGNFVKSTNNAASFFPATNGISGGDRNNWDTPVTFDPNNSQTLYYGTNKLYKTTNAATNWTAISPDLTNGSGGGNLTYGTITTIDVSPIDSNLIYVGTDDGNVWRTDNGGADWQNISIGVPNRWVTKVLADRFDVNRVYVTLSGYRYGEDNGNVFVSNFRGQGWGAIGADLPDIPINDIVRDANGYLYVASDIGVFAAANEAYSWEVLDVNMPAVIVNDLHIHEPSNTLYAATYGRSMYAMDLSSIVLGAPNNVSNTPVTVFPNPSSEAVNIKLPGITNEINLRIYDALGRSVLDESFSDTDILYLSVKELQAGTYFVQVVGDGKKYLQTLIIK